MLLVKSYCILNPKCVFARKIFSSWIDTRINYHKRHLYLSLLDNVEKKVSVSKKPQKKKLENGTRQTKPLFVAVILGKETEKNLIETYTNT